MTNKLQQRARLKARALFAGTLMLGSSPVLANGPGAHVGWVNTFQTATFSNSHTVHHSNTSASLLTGGHNSQHNIWQGGHPGHFVTNLLTASGGAGTISHSANFAATAQAGQLLSLQGLQLDLTSSASNIALGTNLFQGKTSVTIVEGGNSKTILAGSQVTAGEYVAIKEVVACGQQTITLSASGTAVGGSFSLNSTVGANTTELVIPAGVSALDYASSSTNKSININGDLLNYGSIFAVSTNSHITGATISGKDIVNETGGVISTKLPTALLSSIGGAISSLDLTLTASNNIVNAGTIKSSGNLTLASASGSISNIATANAGGSGQVQAAKDINLLTGSGQINNSGLLAATSGSININNSFTSTDIYIYNAGTLQALKGDINIRDTGYSGTSDVNLVGGDYLSKNVNINDGAGAITGSVGQLSGSLNTTAQVEHLSASTQVLVLGHNDITGDPTFVNTGGDIYISKQNVFAEDLAVIASGNIVGDSFATISNPGHDITMVAGAAVTTTGGVASPKNFDISLLTAASPAAPSQLTTGQTATISGASPGGGTIDFRGVRNPFGIDTSNSNGPGGNVTLVAFAGTAANSGAVLIPANMPINTSAGGFFGSKGGNVTIIAGAAPVAGSATTTIQTGKIITSGDSIGGHGGNITLVTSQPTTNDSNPIIFDDKGSVTSGNSFIPGPIISQNANLAVLGALATSPVGQSLLPAGAADGAAAGTIIIHAGNNISTSNLLAFGGGGAGGDDLFPANKGGDGATITVISEIGKININGMVNASGGGGGGEGSSGGGPGAGGAAANITITATSATANNLNISGPIWSVDGGTGGALNGLNAGGGGGSFGGGGGGGASDNAGGSGGGGGAGTSVVGSGGLGGGGGGSTLGNGFAGGGGGITGGKGITGFLGGSGGADATDFNGGLGFGNTNAGGTTGKGGIDFAGNQAGSAQNGGNVSLNGNTMAIRGEIVGKTVQLNDSSSLNILNNITASDTVTLTTLGGDITQQKSFSINTDSLVINTMTADELSGGNAGTAKQALITDAVNITAQSTKFGVPVGSVYINDTGTTVNIKDSGVLTNESGTFSLTVPAAGATINVLTPTDLLATNLILRAPGAGSTISLTGNTIAAAPFANGDGGAISLTANNLSWSGGSSLNIGAVPQTTGNGGSIALVVNQLNGSAVAIGGGPGEIALFADGGSGGGRGGSISLTTTGAVNIDTGSLQNAPQAANGTGGQLTIKAAAIANPSGTLFLDESGQGTGNGGVINISLTGPAANTFIRNTATPGDIQLVAKEGINPGSSAQSAGSISVVVPSSGTLIVDTNAIVVKNSINTNTAVDSAQITLIAGNIQNSAVGPLTLQVNGAGSNSGGNLSLTLTNSPGSVTIGQTGSAQFDLSTSGAAAITFSSNQVLNFETNASGLPTGLNVAANANSGGQLVLTAANFTTNTPTSPLLFDVSATGSGNGGTASITATSGNLTMGTKSGDIQIIANNGPNVGVLQTGGSASLIASSGTLTIDMSGISVLSSSALNPNVSGGTIQLEGLDIALANAASAPLIINASGAGTSSGGTIRVVQFDMSAKLSIGTAANQLQLIANSGAKGGSAGSISVSSAKDLIVNTKGLSVNVLTANGNGGAITLSAGSISPTNNGNLQITGVLAANGKGTGSGGSIVLNDHNDVNNFLMGGVGGKTPTPNGIIGSLSVTGKTAGQISVDASGTAGLTEKLALSVPQSVTLKADSGDLTVSAALGNAKSVLVGLTAGGNIIASSIAGKAVGLTVQLVAGGDIRGTIVKSVTNPFTTTAADLKLTAPSGQIVVNNTQAKTFNLEQSSAGTNFSLTSTGTIIGQAPASGTSLITAGGNISINSRAGITDLLASGNFAESTGGSGNISLVSATAGSGTAVIPLNLQLDVPSGQLSLTSTGNMYINSTGTNTTNLALAKASKILNLTATQADLNIVNTIGTTLSLLTLHAGGSGSIIDTNLLTAPIVGKSINLISDNGAVGSFANSIPVKTGILASSSFGDSVLNDVNRAALVVNKSSSGGFYDLSAGGATTLNSINVLGGDLAVQTDTGLLQTAINAQITATNGEIQFLTNHGTIVIATGTNISTGRPFGNGGNILISVGFPLSAPNTTPPAKFVTVNNTAPGQVTFGKHNITALASKGIGNTLTADMAKIIFDTNTAAASAIKLNGNVNITADPPLPGINALNTTPTSTNITTAVLLPIATSAPAISLPATGPAAIDVQSINGAAINSAAINTSALNHPSAISVTSQISVPLIAAPTDTSFTSVIAARGASLSDIGASGPMAIGSCGSDGGLNWISETELATGSIPAKVISDLDLGIQSTVSTIVDMTTTPDTRQSSVNRLKRGSVLCAPKSDTTIETPFGQVAIAAKSVVLVMVLSDGLAVYNFDDRHQGAVAVRAVDYKDFVLAPGRHALVTRSQECNYGQVNPAQLFAYRGLARHQDKCGLSIFTGEFSLEQALRTVQPVKELFRASINNKEARKIAIHLLKTTGIVNQLTGSAGFKQHLRPSLLAMLN